MLCLVCCWLAGALVCLGHLAGPLCCRAATVPWLSHDGGCVTAAAGHTLARSPPASPAGSTALSAPQPGLGQARSAPAAAVTPRTPAPPPEPAVRQPLWTPAQVLPTHFLPLHAPPPTHPPTHPPPKKQHSFSSTPPSPHWLAPAAAGRPTCTLASVNAPCVKAVAVLPIARSRRMWKAWSPPKGASGGAVALAEYQAPDPRVPLPLTEEP